MGLFSFKNKSLPKVDIPADILADVSVNGEKKVQPVAPLVTTPDLVASRGSTSPFLKTRIEVVSEQPLATASAPEALQAVLAESPAGGPKPFQFSDQSPLPDAVHFTETEISSPEPAVPTPVERPDFSQITQDKALERKKEHLAPLRMKPDSMPAAKRSFWSSGNLISLIVFILILSLISGGSWYYLNTRNTEETVSEEASIGALEQGIAQQQATEVKSTILVDQPNYLALDIETVTLEQIKELLVAEAQKIQAEGVTVPAEYLVVDKNNNPVAFSRFALLVGADTPNTLIEASLEPFSLYLFLDQGMPRTALAVTLRAETPANFPANKNVLLESMKKFFYPEEYASVNTSGFSFAQTSHQGSTIFYTNIDIANNYAFDMTLQEGILTFANSKNTLRAVIDKRLLVSEE